MSASGAGAAVEEEDGRTSSPAELSLVEVWNGFDVEEQKRRMEEASLAMTSRQDASTASRKELTAATKAFRRLEEGEKLKGFKSLLKLYQDEVDRLTRRSRAAEKSFVAVYRDFYSVVDPVPALREATTSSRKVKVLEEVQAQLKDEIAALEEELSMLSNQDITIRELEQRLENMEDDIAEQVEEQVKAKAIELKAAFDAEMAALKDVETENKTRVSSAEESLLQAQRQTDEANSALFDMRTKLDDASAAHESEVEVLNQEMERTQAALLSARKEVEQLRAASAKFSAASAGSAAGREDAAAAARVAEAEAEVARQSDTIATLTQEVRAWQDTVERHKTAHAESMERMQTELRSRMDEIASTREELTKRPTVNELAQVKQQLSVLQALYFNVEAEDDGGGSGDGKAGGGGGGGGDGDGDGGGDGGLHTMVMKRVRQLESALTRTKLQLKDVSSELDSTKADLVASQDTCQDQQKLITRLESEVESGTRQTRSSTKPASLTHESQLTALLSGSGGGSSSSSGSASAAVAASSTSAAGGSAGAPSSASASTSAVAPSSSSTPLPTTPGGTGGDASMVSILQGQRDRFRTRMLELEAETQSLKRQVSDASAKAEKLVEDNVQLYEKVKFLESYSAEGKQGGSMRAAGAAAAAAAPRVNPNQIPEVRRDLEHQSSSASAQYKKLYEHRMNPFTDFSRREKNRRYANLSTAEKITLSTTRFFLSNKFARSFVFFYALGLHLLVSATLYHFTHVSHRDC